MTRWQLFYLAILAGIIIGFALAKEDAKEQKSQK